MINRLEPCKLNALPDRMSSVEVKGAAGAGRAL